MRSTEFEKSWRWLVAAGAVFVPATVMGALTIPHSFTPNTPIKAAQMNENFAAVKAEIDAVGDRTSLVETKTNGLQTQINSVDTKATGLQTRVGNVETQLGNKQNKPPSGKALLATEMGLYAAVFVHTNCSTATCTPSYSFNAINQTNTVKRIEQGRYSITFKGLGANRNVLPDVIPMLTTFRASGGQPAACFINGFTTHTADVIVEIRCVQFSNGALVDSGFGLQIMK